MAVRCKRCFKRFVADIEIEPEVTTLEPMDLPCTHCGGLAHYDWKDFDQEEDEEPR